MNIENDQNSNFGALPVSGDDPLASTISPDPMDVAAGDIDTTFPVLKDGKYPLLITKCEQVAGKDTADLDDSDPNKRWNFKISLATTEPTVSTADEQLAEGFILTTYLSISPTPDYDATKVRKSLAAVLQAAFGKKTTTTPRQWLNNPSLVVDSIVEAKIGHSKPTVDFPNPSNKVSSWIPRKD